MEESSGAAVGAGAPLDGTLAPDPEAGESARSGPCVPPSRGSVSARYSA
jgi:hypothetical protein